MESYTSNLAVGSQVKSIACQTPRSLIVAPRCSIEAQSSTIVSRIGVTRQAPREQRHRRDNKGVSVLARFRPIRVALRRSDGPRNPRDLRDAAGDRWKQGIRGGLFAERAWGSVSGRPGQSFQRGGLIGVIFHECHGPKRLRRTEKCPLFCAGCSRF